MNISANQQTYIPYGRQTITEEDIDAVIDSLRSPMITQGICVPKFEEQICKTVQANYAVSTNSATSALHIACLALGLGPGDSLWTSPTTFVASANCALYCGASVDFVDINPSTGLLDIGVLTSKLERADLLGTLPKIVVPVHLAGTSCDMEAIAKLSQRYGFYVLEDASHAIGGKYRNYPVGSCQFSDITVFSFHPVKIITTGEGGLATTNDKKLAKKMVQLRSHGITKDTFDFLDEPLGPWTYEQQYLGFNYRMTDFQAALGLSQLKRLDCIIKDRTSLFNNYIELLSSLPVKLLEIPSTVESSLHLAVIRLDHQDPSFHLSLFNRLRSSNVGVQLHYAPVHLQPYYKTLGFKRGMFQQSEFYAQNAISLPLYPGLQKTEQIKVVQIIKDFCHCEL